MHEKFHRKALSDVDLHKGINRRAQQLKLSERNTNQGVAKDQSTAHHAKAVARGLGQGVAEPRGQAHPYRCLSATPSSGGGMRACRRRWSMYFMPNIDSRTVLLPV